MRKALSLLLVLAMAANLMACQSEAKAEDAVKGYFEAAKASDMAKANTFVNPKMLVLRLHPAQRVKIRKKLIWRKTLPIISRPIIKKLSTASKAQI